MKIDKKTLVLLAAIFIGGNILVSLLSSLLQPASGSPISLGSVARGGEYLSTTTPNGVADLFVLKNEPGILGSVSMTGGSTGVLYFYDATTTDVNKRTGNTPTSTLRLFVLDGNVGTSTATFTLDAHFYTALLIDIEGTAPTTTITWR